MKKHRKDGRISREQRHRVERYQDYLGRFVGFVKDHFVESTTIYDTVVYTEMDSHNDLSLLQRSPDVFEWHTIEDLAQVILDTFADSRFQTATKDYFAALRESESTVPDENYFSFKQASIHF